MIEHQSTISQFPTLPSTTGVLAGKDKLQEMQRREASEGTFANTTREQYIPNLPKV
jgi:hypothetical protein